MATIKSFTSLEQSKKLAKILPLESADMHYVNDKHAGCVPYLEMTNGSNPWLKGTDISPCWSLAALLSVLPMITKSKDIANPFIAKTPDNEYYVVYATLTKEVDSSAIYDNPVDACVEMILKLKELKML